MTSGQWHVTIYPHTIRAGVVTRHNAVISGYDENGNWRVKALPPEPTAARAAEVAQLYLLGPSTLTID